MVCVVAARFATRATRLVKLTGLIGPQCHSLKFPS
jgi:hypothetical protein